MDLYHLPKIVIPQIAENLELQDEVWHTKSIDPVFYPRQGNTDCFKIENKSYWFNHRNSILRETIVKNSTGKIFFDIGGGNGIVTQMLLNIGFEAWLVEPGIDGIQNAKVRGIGNLINATVEGAGFKKVTLDNIGLFDVVEHIESDKDFIVKIHQLSSSNGKIFITVPAYSFLWSDADNKAGHFRRYSRKSISKLVEESGYRVLYDTYFFSFLVPMIFFFRTIPYCIFRRHGYVNGEGDHSVESKFVKRILNILCKYELKKICNNKRILFGSSCFIVAEKL